MLHRASFVTIDKNWNPKNNKLKIQINLNYQLFDQLIQKSWDEMEFMQCAAAADITLLTFVSFLVSSIIFYCYSQSHQRSELGVKRDLATVQPLLLKATKHCSMHWLLQLAAAQSCDTKKQNFPSTEQGAAAGAAHCPGRGAPAWRVSWRLAAGSWWRSAERS